MAERRLPRRTILAAGAGAIAGVAFTEAANLLIPKEAEQKLVGGVWVGIEQNQKVHGIVPLKFKVKMSDGALVHHVTFTASPDTAPNIRNHPEDIEQGYWKLLGHVRPDPEGMCELNVDLTSIESPKGEIQFSADVYGKDQETGHITSQTINYAPNGIMHLVNTG